MVAFNLNQSNYRVVRRTVENE